MRHKSKLRIGLCPIPGEQLPERLAWINPAFFELHKLLDPLKKTLALTPYHGLKFLAEEPDVESEFRSKSPVGLVGSFHEIRDALLAVAKAEGVETLACAGLDFDAPDERGVNVHLGTDGGAVRATVLVIAGRLPLEQQKLLGIPEEWERDVVKRFSFVLHDDAAGACDLGARPSLPMSLDLAGRLVWAWMFAHGNRLEVAIAQSFENGEAVEPSELLRHWTRVLREHRVLERELPFSPEQVRSMDLPLAGALAHEGVADRSLLVGPAGGFYSACAEDIYPNCWSAIYAADVIKKALKEPHLQDALHPFRHKWRTTLGDYLRGPQHNLRFLLPLVYKNPAMTTRLAESILQGKSVVR